MNTSSASPRGDSLSLDALSPLRLSSLVEAGEFLDELGNRIRRDSEPALWTLLLDPAALQDQLRLAADRRERGITQPLFGIPFAVKDNIDVAGCPTTAGCPQFAYPAATTATADTALAALGRFDMPDAAKAFIAERLWTGASLIVSDEGISRETGRGTDFVILTR